MSVWSLLSRGWARASSLLSPIKQVQQKQASLIPQSRIVQRIAARSYVDCGGYIPEPLAPVYRICVHRYPSPCTDYYEKCDKPCFKNKDVLIRFANSQKDGKLIYAFLMKYYWHREPCVTSLWMCQNTNYLKVLTNKFAYTGDRFLAYEQHPRTNECRLVGVCVANKVYPWQMHEFEKWALNTSSEPERYHMYFMSHYLKSADLFHKYNVPFIYTVEVLATTEEVRGKGIATTLLTAALEHAKDSGYPITQLLCTNYYAVKPCQRNGMDMVWCMNYRDFTDQTSSKIFYTRDPHYTVYLFAKRTASKCG